MLRVATLELSNPVVFLILMKADNPTWKRGAGTGVSPHDDILCGKYVTVE
jgi:hypothetical protein